MIVLSTSIQSLDYVAQKEAFSFIVRINVSDTMYELCFDLFMGTSSNLEPCCAKQKMLVDSHQLLNQCLHNSIESNQIKNEDPQVCKGFECCSVFKCSLRLRC